MKKTRRFSVSYYILLNRSTLLVQQEQLIGKPMIHQELLRRALTTRHPALHDFVETLAPTLLVRFSGVPALGGSADIELDEDETILPPEAIPLTQRDRETFSRTGYD